MCYCNVTVDPSWHPDIGKVERTDTRNEGKLSMLFYPVILVNHCMTYLADMAS